MPLGLRRVKLGGFGPSSTVRERQSTERRLGRSELSELCSCSTESAQKNPCQGPPRTEPPGRPRSPREAMPLGRANSRLRLAVLPLAPVQTDRKPRSGTKPSELCGPSTASRKRVDPAGRTALGFRTWAKCRGSFSNASLSRDCIAWRDHRTTAPRRFVPTPTTKLWTMRTRSEDLKISTLDPRDRVGHHPPRRRLDGARRRAASGPANG